MEFQIANNKVPLQRVQGNQIHEQLFNETIRQTCDLVLHNAAQWDHTTIVVTVNVPFRINKILFSAWKLVCLSLS